MNYKELQVENGNFTRVVNVILEKLALFPFPSKTGLPLKLTLYVIRKTWGYNKKEDYISLTQFEKAVRSNRPSVVHWLDYLVKANILVKGRQLPTKGTLYRFNKYWEQWKWGVKVRKLVKVRSTRWLRKDNQSSYVTLTHKRQLKTIKNIKKGGSLKKNMEYIPINDEGQEVKKVKGLKNPVSDRGEFNYQKELEKLRASGKNHKIVAHYLVTKNYQFENFDQLYPVLSRNMLVAKQLKGYNSKQIGATMEHCQKEWPDNWSLETVVKWIPEISLKIK